MTVDADKLQLFGESVREALTEVDHDAETVSWAAYKNVFRTVVQDQYNKSLGFKAISDALQKEQMDEKSDVIGIDLSQFEEVNLVLNQIALYNDLISIHGLETYREVIMDRLVSFLFSHEPKTEINLKRPDKSGGS